MRKLIALALLGGLVAGVSGPADAGKAKPVTVFTDATGDAGNQDTGAPGFTEA